MILVDLQFTLDVDNAILYVDEDLVLSYIYK